MSNSHKQLINDLTESGVLKSEAIIKSFNKIDRNDFVSDEFQKIAYSDIPLPTLANQTISQPTTVAFMFELLGVNSGDKILDVGSGSGWTTAILADLTGQKGRVWGVEIIPELVKLGNNNLSKYNFNIAKILFAKKLGLPEKAPFDKILVSAAAERIPTELIDQLKKGGTMVIPVRNSIIKLTKDEIGNISETEFLGFVFVPLVNI
ncbi:MAG: protein-L-isoaspartate O-methyltransferase [Patescibacteria group bacterium]|jgi:protein-L-isoaspartate(D-aspartate) O-methyltransferase